MHEKIETNCRATTPADDYAAIDMCIKRQWLAFVQLNGAHVCAKDDRQCRYDQAMASLELLGNGSDSPAVAACALTTGQLMPADPVNDVNDAAAILACVKGR